MPSDAQCTSGRRLDLGGKEKIGLGGKEKIVLGGKEKIVLGVRREKRSVHGLPAIMYIFVYIHMCVHTYMFVYAE